MELLGVLVAFAMPAIVLYFIIASAVRKGIVQAYYKIELEKEKRKENG